MTAPNLLNLDKLMTPISVKIGLNKEARSCQKSFLGKHSVEVRLWERKGPKWKWAPTREHVRIPLDQAVSLSREINEILLAIAPLQAQTTQLQARIAEINTEIRESFLPVFQRQIDEAIRQLRTKVGDPRGNG